MARGLRGRGSEIRSGARRGRSGRKGSRGRSAALACPPPPSAAPARSSLLPVSLPPPPPPRARQLRPPGLAAPPGSPPARPPAARALPPLLCDEGRVSDLTELPPPPSRGAAGMEPLSHRGLPRLSWIDTLYSSTCARGPGRLGGNSPAPCEAPRRSQGPRCPACLGSPARAGRQGSGVGPPRSAVDEVPRADLRRMGGGQRTDGARRAMSPLSHLLCNRPLPSPREEGTALVGCCLRSPTGCSCCPC